VRRIGNSGDRHAFAQMAHNNSRGVFRGGFRADAETRFLIVSSNRQLIDSRFIAAASTCSNWAFNLWY